MNGKIMLIESDNQMGTVEAYEELLNQAKDYISHAKAENTFKAYRNDWKHFVAWCDSHSLSSLPATDKTVAMYLSDMAGQLKTSTLQRRISAISQAHKAKDYSNPTQTSVFRAVWSGIRRTHGVNQQGKAAAVIEDIKVMVDTLEDTVLGIRDRALLLIGFAGAFRRSEIVGLNFEDIEINRDGLTVHLRKSKTDQEGQGRKIGIPYGSYADTCPVRSLQAWLEVSNITEGALFRPVNRHRQIQGQRLSDKAVALIVKRCATAAGLDAAKYAGHSLRAGFATTAAAKGKSERSIMNQTGHKSVNMVRRYIREANLFKDNAAAGIGL